MKTKTNKRARRKSTASRALVKPPELTKEAQEILDAAMRVGNARIFRPVYELPSQRYVAVGDF